MASSLEEHISETGCLIHIPHNAPADCMFPKRFVKDALIEHWRVDESVNLQPLEEIYDPYNKDKKFIPGPRSVNFELNFTVDAITTKEIQELSSILDKRKRFRIILVEK